LKESAMGMGWRLWRATTTADCCTPYKEEASNLSDGRTERVLPSPDVFLHGRHRIFHLDR
jgi:hypothetical protein